MVSIQRDTYKIRRNFRLIHRLPDLARIISWTRWNTYRGIGRPITRIPSPPTWPLPQIQIYTHVHSILWNEYEYVISRILVVHGWNERRRRGVGRGRNEEGNETPVFQRCCIHEAEWTDGRCTLEHELSLSPSVNARLHGAWTCPLAIYTEWPPVTWVYERRYTLDRDELRRLTSNFTGRRSSSEGFRFFFPSTRETSVWYPRLDLAFRLSRLPLSTSPHLQHNARGSACATHEDRHRISGLTRDDGGQGWVTMRRDNDLDAKNVIRKFSVYVDNPYPVIATI